MKKKFVALTGAGISAESGISTFRDSDGMWDKYDVMKVASIVGWYENPDLMLRFYNERRRQLAEVEPNAAHRILAELQSDFDVNIITQNIDDLHERAGSANVMHLHGELTKARSSKNDTLIFDVGYNDINPGDVCSDGSPTRPHVVWFGEAVPMIEPAAELVMSADIFVVIGTSLKVYPAAGLIRRVRSDTPVFVIDPDDIGIAAGRNVTAIKEKATVGAEKLKDILMYLK